MAEQERRERSMSERAFWVRLALTMLLIAVPMGWLISFYDVPLTTVLAAAGASAVALLAIWDTSRLLPDGLVLWGQPKAMRDEVTGLYNPEGWTELLAAEEDRCSRHDMRASVVVVQVAGDGEPTIERLAEVGGRIKMLCRKHDVAAYLDEGTFGVLAVGSGARGSEVLVARLVDALGRQGIRVRWAVGERTESLDLPAAWEDATGRMADSPPVNAESG